VRFRPKTSETRLKPTGARGGARGQVFRCNTFGTKAIASSAGRSRRLHADGPPPPPGVPRALYHVTARGNERKPIVRDDGDRGLWLQCLERVCSRFGWLGYAYCLRQNHFHLLVETPVPNLARAMRELNGVYAQDFNRRHRRSGHLFGGRYRALLVQGESHLLECARYVVLNLERVALPSERYDRYRWSSYRATAGLVRAPAFLAHERILELFSHDHAQARRLYLPHSARPRPLPRARSGLVRPSLLARAPRA
jgi:REP element-mobilizing transposase RayT